jgi:hypothetical protein
LINFKKLLLLALALTLGLASRTSNEVFLFFLRDGFGVSPLLVLLATLIGLTSLRNTSTKGKLLLSKLSEVVRVRDAVVLRLELGGGFGSGGINWRSVAVTSQSVLLFGIGNSFTSLLISEFGSAFISTPAMASLLLGITEHVRKAGIQERR